MRACIICLAGMPVLVGFAQAQARYDVKLEEAVKAVIAGKIGDIRPGLAFSQVPRVSGSKAAAQRSVPLPAPKAGSWKIVDGDSGLEASTSGSFQTFSDGTTPTEAERRAWSRKTVSRVINF